MLFSVDLKICQESDLDNLSQSGLSCLCSLPASFSPLSTNKETIVDPNTLPAVELKLAVAERYVL